MRRGNAMLRPDEDALRNGSILQRHVSLSVKRKKTETKSVFSCFVNTINFCCCLVSIVFLCINILSGRSLQEINRLVLLSYRWLRRNDIISCPPQRWTNLDGQNDIFPIKYYFIELSISKN